MPPRPDRMNFIGAASSMANALEIKGIIDFWVVKSFKRLPWACQSHLANVTGGIITPFGNVTSVRSILYSVPTFRLVSHGVPSLVVPTSENFRGEFTGLVSL